MIQTEGGREFANMPELALPQGHSLVTIKHSDEEHTYGKCNIFHCS